MRWGRRVIGAAFIVVGPALPGHAQQPAPFDMGIERQQIEPAPVVETPAPAIDAGGLRLNTISGVGASGAAPADPIAPAPVVVPVVAADGTYERPIIPYNRLSLSGENDARAWTVYLTDRQAAASAVLHVGYINALLVAPEASLLTVLINDRPVISTPIASSDAPAQLAVPLPTELLRAGANRIRFEVTQRHRTDCNVESTYDLWTEVDPAATYLSFADPDAATVATVADLAAIGVDATGITIINVLVPSLQQPAATHALLRLTEALALLLGTPTPVVRVSTTELGLPGAGILSVILGTSDEVAAAIGQPLSSAVTFLTGGSGPTLVVSGANWPMIETAIGGLIAPVDVGTTRSVVASASWHIPEVPILIGGDAIAISALGIETAEFSGRRFRTGFLVSMPSDLYAQAYGHATLFLDAAYAPEVLPGGHVDVFVNGNIAVTTPIAVRGGGIFRHLEVEIPLRHFQPGVNAIDIEAIVPTAADAVCAPGTPSLNTPRFVLFDTTTFAMPSFGRATQFPDLSALSGVGSPLAAIGNPLSLVIGGTDEESYSAAATLIARLATVAGRPFEVIPVASAANAGTEFGLFVGPIRQLPSTVADRAGIADTAIEGWEELGAESDTPAPADAVDTEQTFERWRDALAGGGGWRGQVSSLEEWLRRTFDFSFASLRFGGAQTLDYSPTATTGLMLAEGPRTTGQTSWTVLTAPNPRLLAENTEALVRPDTWRQVNGQIALYHPATGEVETVPLPGADLLLNGPATPENLRLVATNWLSKNLIVYGALLLGLCTLLGISTSWLLNSVGRQG